MKNKQLKTKLWAIYGMMEEMRKNNVEHNITLSELNSLGVVTDATYEHLMEDDNKDNQILLRELVIEVLEEGSNE